jgi:cysteine sulfinate desulfinase/cysteine desulfurase-like protein
VWIHVDAAQAVGRVPVSFRDLGADFMSVSAHKFGGPSGIGALVIRRGVRVPPMLVGGDQERARRAGMEAVAAIMGFGAAALKQMGKAAGLSVVRHRELPPEPKTTGPGLFAALLRKGAPRAD